MKLAIRVPVFVLGVALLLFGWHKAHTEIINLQSRGTANQGSPSEVLIVIGVFIALLAFLPSQETLGRWMSLKRKHHAPPAHFRRRRETKGGRG